MDGSDSGTPQAHRSRAARRAPATRPRDSAATRRALLAAARELFATHGYDATTVRAIADRAGVNQALLFRHFGNKEGLFTAAVTGQALEVLEGVRAEDVVARTLAAILQADGPESTLFFAALRSAGNTDASATIRDELRAAYGAPLRRLVQEAREQAGEGDEHGLPVGDDDVALRTELVLAWLLGIALLRTVIRSDALGAADPHEVIGLVTRSVDVLLGRAP